MIELETTTPFFQDKQEVVDEILSRYPEEGRRSALMPLLWEVQRAERYISEARMHEIAEIVGITATEVKGVLSFYSTYHEQPVGRYHIQICSTLSCALAGADEMYDHLVNELGIVNGETDAEADALEDAEAEASMAILQDVISRVRGIRAEHDIPRAKNVEIVVEALDDRARKALEEGRIFVEALAGGTLQIEADGKRLAEPHAHFEGAAVFAGPSVRGAIPGVIDPEKERARLTRELAKIEKELDALEKKLGNESFVARAPADVVEKAKADRDALAARKAQIGASLARLSG